jgi:hypothetical protein
MFFSEDNPRTVYSIKMIIDQDKESQQEIDSYER